MVDSTAGGIYSRVGGMGEEGRTLEADLKVGERDPLVIYVTGEGIQYGSGAIRSEAEV